MAHFLHDTKNIDPCHLCNVGSNIAIKNIDTVNVPMFSNMEMRSAGCGLLEMTSKRYVFSIKC